MPGAATDTCGQQETTLATRGEVGTILLPSPGPKVSWYSAHRFFLGTRAWCEALHPIPPPPLQLPMPNTFLFTEVLVGGGLQRTGVGRWRKICHPNDLLLSQRGADKQFPPPAKTNGEHQVKHHGLLGLTPHIFCQQGKGLLATARGSIRRTP